MSHKQSQITACILARNGAGRIEPVPKAELGEKIREEKRQGRKREEGKPTVPKG